MGWHPFKPDDFTHGLLQVKITVPVAQFVPNPFHFCIFQVFVKTHRPVYDPARGDLHYPVCHGCDELVVM
jgi:hypothetical protein